MMGRTRISTLLVSRRIEIAMEILRNNPEKKLENSLIKKAGKDENIDRFPNIDAYKFIARLRIKTENLYDKGKLEKRYLKGLIDSGLKFSNDDRGIINLNDDQYVDYLKKRLDEWYEMPRDKAIRKGKESIVSSDFTEKKRFQDHNKLKEKFVSDLGSTYVFVRCEYEFKDGMKPDIICWDESGRITIVEVKVDFKDFSSKKEKIHQYMDYCNYFYLLTDKEKIATNAVDLFTDENNKWARHGGVLLYNKEKNIIEEYFKPLKQEKISKLHTNLLEKMPELYAEQIAKKIRMLDWKEVRQKNAQCMPMDVIKKVKDIIGC